MTWYKPEEDAAWLGLVGEPAAWLAARLEDAAWLEVGGEEGRSIDDVRLSDLGIPPIQGICSHGWIESHRKSIGPPSEVSSTSSSGCNLDQDSLYLSIILLLMSPVL